MSPPVFGVTGWKNSGKTTLMRRLIAEFTARGYGVSAMKHAHLAFDIDHAGRDSHQFREAGAREVALASPKRWALMHELRAEAEPGFAEMVARIGPCDLLLVEGWKGESFPKIETRRADSLTRGPLAKDDPHIVAVAARGETDAGRLPLFALDDVAGIADFIERHLGLARK